MNDAKKLTEEISKEFVFLKKQMPEALDSFSAFMAATTKDGALSHKQKELIAVALSIVKQCDWCIAIHVKKSLEAGSTRDEILGAAWVAALMGGGPALMYMQLVIKALEDFEEKK